MRVSRMVEVPCTVCGAEDQEVVLPRQGVEAHLRYLHLFHRRRLRPSGGDDEAALRDRADFTQDYATDIVACRGCGLVLRNPRPPARAIARAYRADSYGPERLASLFAAQLELGRRQVAEAAPFLPERPRLIEVGSFVGGFLAAAQERRWDALGVDPGEEVGAFCRARGLRVHGGTLDTAPVEPAGLHAVAIWNTFDQLPDPAPTLRAARRLLRPGGVLILRVPSGACFRLLCGLQERLPPSLSGPLRAAMAWNNLLAFPYLHGYAPRTLDLLLRPYGLRRVGLRADVLPRLSDERTRSWAAWEERGLKLLWRALPARTPLPIEEGALSPWLDVYYRAEALDMTRGEDHA